MTQDIGQIRRMSKITTTVFFCCCHFVKTFGRVCLEIEGGRPTTILRDLPRKKIICLFCRMSNGHSLSPLLLLSSIFSRPFDRSVACSRVGLYLSRETKGETTNHRHECFSFFHLTLLIEKYSNMTNEICMWMNKRRQSTQHKAREWKEKSFKWIKSFNHSSFFSSQRSKHRSWKE